MVRHRVHFFTELWPLKDNLFPTTAVVTLIARTASRLSTLSLSLSLSQERMNQASLCLPSQKSDFFRTGGIARKKHGKCIWIYDGASFAVSRPIH